MCEEFDPSSIGDYVVCSPVNQWAIGELFGGAAESAGESIGGSMWESICLSFAEAAMQLMEGFASAFVAFPNVDLQGGGVSAAYSISLGIAAIVAAILMLVQVIRTAFTAEGRPMAEAIVGLGKAALAFMLTLTIASTALVAADELASWIIDQTFDGGSDGLRDNLAALMAFGGPEVSVSLIFLIALVGIILTLVLWFELLLRNAAIAVLIATSPIAAVGQMSHTTKQWWSKLVSATLQLIVMKPLIALIFALGFSLIGGTDTDEAGATDVATLLTGMLILLMAALAWPAIARFMTFTSTHVGGGSGLAAVAGAGAGYLGGKAAGGAGGGATSPNQFGQASEARTMAAVDGRMAAAGGKAAGAGGGAMKAAGAAGPWVAAAAAGLKAVQQGANSLTQRMEQTAAHGGVEGANPYALPGGYPRYHQGAGRPPGPDTGGEPRPSHAAPRTAPPPPDHGDPGAAGSTSPPPAQPSPPNTDDQGGKQ